MSDQDFSIRKYEDIFLFTDQINIKGVNRTRPSLMKGPLYIYRSLSRSVFLKSLQLQPIYGHLTGLWFSRAKSRSRDRHWFLNIQCFTRGSKSSKKNCLTIFFVCPIITHKPLDRFLNFLYWETRENNGNVLKLV